MPKCILIFEDVDNDVVASVMFDPELPEGVERPLLTNAQQLGMRLLEASFAVLSGIEDED